MPYLSQVTVLFVEMSVNVVFARLFVQRNEFNMCYRMALKYELLLLLLSHKLGVHPDPTLIIIRLIFNWVAFPKYL